MRIVRSVIVCLLIVVAVLNATEDQKFVPISREFLDKIRNESMYNRYSTPTQYDGKYVIDTVIIFLFNKGIPTNVSMSMYIESISSFSAQTMVFAKRFVTNWICLFFQDYHLDMYFQQVSPFPIIAALLHFFQLLEWLSLDLKLRLLWDWQSRKWVQYA